MAGEGGGGGGDGLLFAEEIREKFPCEFPYDFSSLSSPVGSATETESEHDEEVIVEEDYLDGLTRQMAHSFLLDDDENLNHSALAPINYNKRYCQIDNTNTKVSGVMGTSPQSTLCGMGLRSGSGSTSPNGRSLSPTPQPKASFIDQQLELLRSAAGQVALMRLSNAQAEAEKSYSRCLLADPKKNDYASQLLTAQQQLKFEQLKLHRQQQQQQLLGAWGKENRIRSSGGCGGGAGVYVDTQRSRQLGLPSLQTQHRQQQHQHRQHDQAQPSSGMRAVFLNSTRRTNGTGVFLPQRSGNHVQTRKKPACSTVLLPARVVQALNLNLEDMGAHPRLPGTFVLDHDTLLMRGSAQKRSSHVRSHPLAPAAHEQLRLPAEWTY